MAPASFILVGSTIDDVIADADAAGAVSVPPNKDSSFVPLLLILSVDSSRVKVRPCLPCVLGGGPVLVLLELVGVCSISLTLDGDW